MSVIADEAQRIREYDSRIKALRDARAAANGRQLNEGEFDKALEVGSKAAEGPAASKPEPTPREAKVLEAARSLYGGSGVARPGEIAVKLGKSALSVSQAITTLRAKGIWPYQSPVGMGRASKPDTAKAKAKGKPSLARLDATAAKPKAVEAVRPMGSPGPIFDVLRAFDALPPEVQAPLADYLASRVTRAAAS
jgi:hypothetical protein